MPFGPFEYFKKGLTMSTGTDDVDRKWNTSGSSGWPPTPIAFAGSAVAVMPGFSTVYRPLHAAFQRLAAQGIGVESSRWSGFCRDGG